MNNSVKKLNKAAIAGVSRSDKQILNYLNIYKSQFLILFGQIIIRYTTAVC